MHSDRLIGYKGKAYLAVARLATPEMVAADEEWQAMLKANNSRIAGSNGLPIEDTRWTTKWSNYTLSRNFSTGYMFRSYTKGCYYMDTNKWTSYGMAPEEEHSSRYLRCYTNHLTPFSSGLFEPPNNVDFDYVFAEASFDNNLSIYAALLILLATFGLFLAWAKWKDGKDAHKLRSMPLSDNDGAVMSAFCREFTCDGFSGGVHLRNSRLYGLRQRWRY